MLSLPSTERDFRLFLTLSNLQKVFDQPNDFIIPKVLRINFKGLERRSSKIAGTKSSSCSHLRRVGRQGDGMCDLGDAYRFVAPSSQPSFLLRMKGLREGETEYVAKLRQQIQCTQ